VWICPTRIDDVASALRTDGFSAPAAKNFSIFVQRECAAR
jgi:hypothetical protein